MDVSNLYDCSSYITKLDSPTVANLFYNIEVSHNTEVPVLFTTAVVQFLHTHDKKLSKEHSNLFDVLKDNILTLKVPINIVRGRSSSFRTVSPLLRYFISDRGNSDLLPLRVKEYTYYVGKGVFLDSNKLPLILATHNLNIDTKNKEIKYNALTFHINPVVYTRDDPMSKYIKGTLLSKLVDATNDVISTRLWNLTNSGTITEDWKSIKVDISYNIEKFFYTTPDRQISDTDTKLNSLLLKKLKDCTY